MRRTTYVPLKEFASAISKSKIGDPQKYPSGTGSFAYVNYEGSKLGFQVGTLETPVPVPYGPKEYTGKKDADESASAASSAQASLFNNPSHSSSADGDGARPKKRSFTVMLDDPELANAVTAADAAMCDLICNNSELLKKFFPQKATAKNFADFCRGNYSELNKPLTQEGKPKKPQFQVRFTEKTKVFRYDGQMKDNKKVVTPGTEADLHDQGGCYARLLCSVKNIFIVGTNFGMVLECDSITVNNLCKASEVQYLDDDDVCVVEDPSTLRQPPPEEGQSDGNGDGKNEEDDDPNQWDVNDDNGVERKRPREETIEPEEDENPFKRPRAN